MNTQDLDAAIDELSDRIASRMTDAQQLDYWRIAYPRGGLPDLAAGLAYLEGIAATLAPDAPDLDALGVLVPATGDPCPDCGEPKPARKGRCRPCAQAALHVAGRNVCPGCRGPKHEAAERCRACLRAAIAAESAAKRVCAGCGGVKDRNSHRCKRCAGRFVRRAA